MTKPSVKKPCKLKKPEAYTLTVPGAGSDRLQSL